MKTPLLLTAGGNEGQATFTMTVNQPATLPDPWIGMYDLGNLGEAWASAHAINSRRQVVGFSSVPYPGPGVPVPANGTYIRAFLWSPSLGMQDLGTLGGHQSWARSINEQGVVVGEDKDAAGSLRGFRIVPLDANGDGTPDTWFQDANADGVNDLMGMLAHGTDPCRAYDVNASGQAVGAYVDPSETWHAVVWQPDGSCVDSGIAVGDNNSVSINDAGWVAAEQSLRGANGLVTLLPGVGFDLSELGTVLLRWPDGWGSEGRLWHGGDVTATLRKPGHAARPRALNDDEQVVGIQDGASAPAFVWTGKGGFIELPCPGGSPGPATQTAAYDIHADGLWVGGFAMKPGQGNSSDAQATLWTLPPNTPQGDNVGVALEVAVSAKFKRVRKEGLPRWSEWPRTSAPSRPGTKL